MAIPSRGERPSLRWKEGPGEGRGWGAHGRVAAGWRTNEVGKEVDALVMVSRAQNPQPLGFRPGGDLRLPRVTPLGYRFLKVLSLVGRCSQSPNSSMCQGRTLGWRAAGPSYSWGCHLGPGQASRELGVQGNRGELGGWSKPGGVGGPGKQVNCVGGVRGNWGESGPQLRGSARPIWPPCVS